MRYNLSEIVDVIQDRRTIFPEQFSSRKVHKEIIFNLLESARWAPSHKLTQPWMFKVFMGEGRKRFADFQAATYQKRTSEENFKQSKFEKLSNRPMMASAVIAICMKRDEEKRIPEEEEIAAVAAAVENMWLHATAYGLAFYWGSGALSSSDEMKQFLGIEEKDKCLGILYIGYPEIEWPRKTPRKPVEYYTQWIES